MNEFALFAGAGGGLLATHHLLGWRCIGYIEKEEYPARVLEARIKDGLLSRAPIFQMHLREFIQRGYPEMYQGLVDVVTAGFPCQPFSRAGKGLAEADERNGWPDTISFIRLVRPRYVLLENVANLIAKPYFGTILGDMAESGYDYQWDCIPASAIGANHQRDRLWIIAYDTSQGERSMAVERQPHQKDLDLVGMGARKYTKLAQWWETEPGLGRMANGVAHRVERRLEAIGNGQVPGVVREIWRLLIGQAEIQQDAGRNSETRRR